MHNQTDEELVQAYYQGDHAAFRELFERYKVRVLNFCLRILGNRADAEDVTSEVFMALAERRYIMKAEAKCATWVYTVARNSCISKIRKRKRTLSLWFSKNNDGDVRQFDPQDTEQLPPDKIIEQEHIFLIQSSIKDLPLPQREALVLREYQKLSYQEISTVLDYSLEKVKILIFRARENLRAIVIKRDPEFSRRQRNVE